MLQSDGTCFEVPCCLDVRVSPRAKTWKQVFYLYTQCKGSLTHSPPAKASYMMLDSLPLYANCLCTMRVFLYDSIHTISTCRVSWFSRSDPLPFFRIVEFLNGGKSICFVCAYTATFSTVVFANWPTNLMCCYCLPYDLACYCL